MRKNQNKVRLSKAMLMPVALSALVDVLEHGEKKYTPAIEKSWLEYDPTEVLDSLLRHAQAIANGEFLDQEGYPHAACLVFNAAVYAELTANAYYFSSSSIEQKSLEDLKRS